MDALAKYQLGQQFLADFKDLAEEYAVATRGAELAHDLLDLLNSTGEFESLIIKMVRIDIRLNRQLLREGALAKE